MKGIGVVFNIDDLGGGSYGNKAWHIFMNNIKPETIIGCELKQGDTEQTLYGNQREFCIGVFGLLLDESVDFLFSPFWFAYRKMRFVSVIYVLFVFFALGISTYIGSY